MRWCHYFSLPTLLFFFARMMVAAAAGPIPHRWLRLSSIQHSCCMMNRLFYCLVDFVCELWSYSTVLFIWSIYMAILTGRITDLARLSVCLCQILLTRYSDAVGMSHGCRSSSSVVFCNECIVAKWCKIGPRLLLITNRKSNTGFQMTLKSLTLDDLECTMVCQSCAIVATW